VSQTVAVILDEDHRFWAYDVSQAILAVEVIRLAEDASTVPEPWLASLLGDLRMALPAQGTVALDLPTDPTETQRESLQALFTRAGQRLRARSSMTAEQATEVYVVDDHPVFYAARQPSTQPGLPISLTPLSSSCWENFRRRRLAPPPCCTAPTTIHAASDGPAGGGEP
jgi:hypothetical protein